MFRAAVLPDPTRPCRWPKGHGHLLLDLLPPFIDLRGYGGEQDLGSKPRSRLSVPRLGGARHGGDLLEGDWPQSSKGMLTGGSPRYQIYPTKDNRHVAAAPLEQKFWESFCESSK
jgi:hypothetical protein